MVFQFRGLPADRRLRAAAQRARAHRCHQRQAPPARAGVDRHRGRAVHAAAGGDDHRLVQLAVADQFVRDRGVFVRPRRADPLARAAADPGRVRAARAAGNLRDHQALRLPEGARSGHRVREKSARCHLSGWRR